LSAVSWIVLAMIAVSPPRRASTTRNLRTDCSIGFALSNNAEVDLAAGEPVFWYEGDRCIELPAADSLWPLADGCWDVETGACDVAVVVVEVRP